MERLPIMTVFVVIPERRRAGPVPHLRRQVPDSIKIDQGRRMYELVLGRGLSVRAAAASLGLSPTTGWRRFWLFSDWLMLPRTYGRPVGPYPGQRGTRACPSGRPFLPTLDAAPPLPPVRRVKGLPIYFGPGGRRDFVWRTGAIGRRLGVSRERARQLSHRPDFPRPVGRLDGARAWATDDVEWWIAQHRPHLADGPIETQG